MFWVTGTHSHKRIILTSNAKNMSANPDFLNTQNIIEAICQGCRRFETSVFFSVKINISTTGGFRVGFFQPDTNHP